jgi:hypothetical protein
MLDRDDLADRALAAEAKLERLRERLERASAEGDTDDAHFASELLSLLNEPTEPRSSPRPRSRLSRLRRR